MDGTFDIPDATDWLETPLSGLATVENALHCSICKDFYDTPMITSCCHTFCSKCIRTSLSADGKCPACRTADQASKLRNNWALQELVGSFLDARPAVLDVARKEKEAAAQEIRRPQKRKRVVLRSEDEPVRTTRSKSRRIAASQESQPEILEVDDSEEDETFEPEEPAPEDGLVECPLGCGKRMKIEAVEPHLDKCEDERKRASRSESRTPVNGLGHSNTFGSLSAQPKPQDRLPELSYSLFNETKLAKKLKELGIPSTGSKQLMVKRHKEWVNIWNANCDSNRPRSKRELLQELDSWERTQGGKAPNANGLASTIMRKDFDANGWASSNRSDFSRLIADAKRKKSDPAIDTRDDKAEESVDAVKADGPVRGLSDSAEQSVVHAALSEGSGAVARASLDQAMGATSDVSGETLPQQDPIGQFRVSEEQATARSLPSSLPQESSKDEHAAHEKTGAPCELPPHVGSSESPVKKMPMFTVPSEARGDGPSIRLTTICSLCLLTSSQQLVNARRTERTIINVHVADGKVLQVPKSILDGFGMWVELRVEEACERAEGGHTPRLNFHNQNSQAWEILLFWAYKHELPAHADNDDDPEPLLKAWLLGQHLEVSAFQDLLMLELLDIDSTLRWSKADISFAIRGASEFDGDRVLRLCAEVVVRDIELKKESRVKDWGDCLQDRQFAHAVNKAYHRFNKYGEETFDRFGEGEAKKEWWKKFMVEEDGPEQHWVYKRADTTRARKRQRKD